MMDPARTPVIVGVAQVVERSELTTAQDLLNRAAARAFDDAPGIGRCIDEIDVVNVLSPVGRAPAARLAASLGVTDAVTETTTVGGNTPIFLLNRAAERIVSGDRRAVLVAGAEALRSERRRRDEGRPAHFVDDDGWAPDRVVGDGRLAFHETEMAVGLLAPVHVYPLLETALAHRDGRDPHEQRRHLGELMAPFTEVAATQPCSWFPERATASELSDIYPGNRLVVEPYTKRMCSLVEVDQAAAFVMCDLATAQQLGLADRVVFPWAGALADDAFHVVARPDLARSAGIAAAAASAFAAAGVGIDDIGVVDLYSCFPSAVQQGADAVGLAVDDPRGLTVTGGLPYYGGPGNAYAVCSVAATVERLREEGGHGLVTGLGWFVTKHGVVVLGASPPPSPFVRCDMAEAQRRIDAEARPVVPTASGDATIAAVSCVADREQGYGAATAIVEVGDGQRTVARADPAGLGDLIGLDLVGRRVRLDGNEPPMWRLM